MPRVEIPRSTSRLPTSTGGQLQGSFSADPLAGASNLAVGTSLMQQDAERNADIRKAENATFVANETVRAQTALLEMQKRRQQEYMQNPKGYAEAIRNDAKTISEGITSSAPSAEARNSLIATMGAFSNSASIQAQAWERQTTVNNFLGSHEDSLNMLSNQVADSPETLSDALIQHEMLMEAATTYLADDPNQLKKLREAGESQIIDGFAVGSIKSRPGDFLRQLDEGVFDDTLTPRQKESYYKLAQQQIKANQEKTIKENQRLATETENNILLGIHTAPDTESLVNQKVLLEKAFEQGIFDVKKSLLSLTKKYRQRWTMESWFSTAPLSCKMLSTAM